MSLLQPTLLTAEAIFLATPDLVEVVNSLGKSHPSVLGVTGIRLLVIPLSYRVVDA
jgi:hypothetical protein